MSDWEVFLHFLRRLFYETPVLKSIVAIMLGLGQIVWGPWTKAYTTILLLWLGDMFLGVLCSWLSRKDVVRSRRIFHSLIKFIIYASVLLVGYQLQNQISFIGIPINFVVVAVILVTESLSVLENSNKLCILIHFNFPGLSQLIRIIQGRQEKILSEMKENTVPK